MASVCPTEDGAYKTPILANDPKAHASGQQAIAVDATLAARQAQVCSSDMAAVRARLTPEQSERCSDQMINQFLRATVSNVDQVNLLCLAFGHVAQPTQCLAGFRTLQSGMALMHLAQRALDQHSQAQPSCCFTAGMIRMLSISNVRAGGQAAAGDAGLEARHRCREHHLQRLPGGPTLALHAPGGL